MAEAIVAAQDAGLVDTSIDPPPILDILIKGYAIDARTLKNPAAKKTVLGGQPEVFGGWFTGYGKREGGRSTPRPTSGSSTPARASRPGTTSGPAS